jgi:hypothetical protein
MSGRVTLQSPGPTPPKNPASICSTQLMIVQGYLGFDEKTITDLKENMNAQINALRQELARAKAENEALKDAAVP